MKKLFIIFACCIAIILPFHVSASGSAQEPNITTHPAGGTVFVSDVITLAVEASVTDGGTLSYQWYSNTNDSNTTGSLINGATNKTFTAPTSAAGTIFYYVVVKNTSNGLIAEIPSNTARVTVNARVNAQTPNITAQLGSGSVSQNGSINLSVTAAVTDGGTLSYQWFSNTTNSNSGGTQISGATKASYAPPTDTVGDVFYYVVVTNTNNNASGSTTATANSSAAKVTVNALIDAEAPEILDQPAGGKVALDSKIILIVSARISDGGKLTCQWFSNEINSNTGGKRIGGGTGDSYTPPTDETGEMFYYVEITNTKDDATGEKTAKTVSEAVSVIVFTTPGAPMEVIAMPSNDEVLVSWKSPRDDGGSEITGYEVSDDGVIWFETTMDNRYLFTGVTVGEEYTFRVRALNDAGHGEEASVTVMVPEHLIVVTGVMLSQDYLEILVGERAQLKATVFPDDADDKAVTWESSDETVATVNDRGLVSALSKGNVTITVTTNDRRFTATCDVHVGEKGGSSGGSILLWLLLSAVIAAGGVGVYLWLRKRNARGARVKSGNMNVNKDATRGAAGDVTRDATRGVTVRDATMDATGDLPVDITRGVTGDLTRDATRDVTRDIARDVTRELNKDASEDITRDISRDVSNYLNNDVSIDVSEDISRDVTSYLNNDKL